MSESLDSVVALLDAIELLEMSFCSESEDSGSLTIEELEFWSVLTVLGLEEVSSPQATRMLAVSKLQMKRFVFILIPFLLIQYNLLNKKIKYFQYCVAKITEFGGVFVCLRND